MLLEIKVFLKVKNYLGILCAAVPDGGMIEASVNPTRDSGWTWVVL